MIALAAVAALAPAAPAAPVGKGDLSKVELPVPDKSLVVVQVNGVGAARDKLTKFLETAVPELAPKAKKQFDAALKDLLEGRDLSAVTPDARAYLIVTSFDDLAQVEAPVALVLPTASYKAFRERFLTADERKSFEAGNGGVDRFDSDEKAAYLVDLRKHGYAAATYSKEAAELLASKFEPLTGARIGATVAPVFLGSDLSVYVNLAEVNDRYGDQIRQFRALFQGLLQQGGMGLVPGLDKRQIEQAKAVYEALFQAVEDGYGLAVGVEFKPEGLLLRAEMGFGKETATGKLFAAERPAPLDRLAGLPRGQALYSAGRLSPGLAKAVSALAREFSAGEDAEKAASAIEKYMELSAEAGAEGWVSAGSGPRGSLQVMTAINPGKLVEAHVHVLKSLPEGGWYQNLALKEKPSVAEGDQTHRGFTLNRATLVLDFEAAVANIPDENLRKAAIESMKRLVSEKTTYWFGSDGKRFVQVASKDWGAARKLLDSYLDGKETIGDDEAFRAVQKQLPEEASQVVVVEVGESLVTFGGYMKSVVEALPGFPGADLPDLKPVKGEPQFVGLAVVLKPGSVGASAVVPAGAVATARKVLSPLFEKKDD
jgi:hypothetical protein